MRPPSERSWTWPSHPTGPGVAALSTGGELTIGPAHDLSLVDQRVTAQLTPRYGGESVAWTTDGRFIMTDGDDGARLWDAVTLDPIGGVFPHDVARQSAELAPGGLRLVTQVGDEVVVWNVDMDSWPDIGCRAVGRNMTQAEWTQFGPRDAAYEATCPQWPHDDDGT